MLKSCAFACTLQPAPIHVFTAFGRRDVCAVLCAAAGKLDANQSGGVTTPNLQTLPKRITLAKPLPAGVKSTPNQASRAIAPPCAHFSITTYMTTPTANRCCAHAAPCARCAVCESRAQALVGQRCVAWCRDLCIVPALQYEPGMLHAVSVRGQCMYPVPLFSNFPRRQKQNSHAKATPRARVPSDHDARPRKGKRALAAPCCPNRVTNAPLWSLV